MARQERAIRTKLAILNAAAAVFDERGYEAATIGEVLTRAGVTKGALYFHFPSKQALAEGVLSQQFANVAVERQACRLQEFVDTGLLVAYRMRRDPMVSAVARLSLEQDMSTQFGTAALTQWIETSQYLLHEAKGQGELLPHVDPAESAWLFSAAWTGVQVFSQILEGREGLEARVVMLFEHLLPAIAVPAVLNRLIITADRAAELGAAGSRAADRPDRPEPSERLDGSAPDALAERDTEAGQDRDGGRANGRSGRAGQVQATL
ncbi:ScbR family autoregulator-binding transcription factor [Streptomyces sp. NPDC059785]|uniref:ScbR family autoregulator-binding transcription factor n=1 Tax=unclassified Streptomyces TaxID=2593676 RepID=UPI003653DA17